MSLVGIAVKLTVKGNIRDTPQLSYKAVHFFQLLMADSAEIQLFNKTFRSEWTTGLGGFADGVIRLFVL